MVSTTLDELLGAPYAINVHESAENIGNYIACDEITDQGQAMSGTPATGGRQIEIQLRELNGSGFEGRAMLAETSDGMVQVTVQLMRVQGAGLESGSPTASPTS